MSQSNWQASTRFPWSKETYAVANYCLHLQPIEYVTSRVIGVARIFIWEIPALLSFPCSHLSCKNHLDTPKVEYNW
jgi:hypothetical protein